MKTIQLLAVGVTLMASHAQAAINIQATSAAGGLTVGNAAMFGVGYEGGEKYLAGLNAYYAMDLSAASGASKRDFLVFTGILAYNLGPDLYLGARGGSAMPAKSGSSSSEGIGVGAFALRKHFSSGLNLEVNAGMGTSPVYAFLLGFRFL